MVGRWFVGLLLIGLSQGGSLPGIAIPEFTLDLGLKPEDRWNHIVKNEYVSQIVQILDIVEPNTTPQMKKIAADVAADLSSYFPKEYADETMGLLALINKIHPNITLVDMVMMQILYDVTAFGCTSIVAETESGQIFHARNLDYGLPLRNMTFTVHFQKNGKTMYTGVVFAGSVGLLTAQRPHGFTITLDERDQGNSILNYNDFKTEGKNVSWWQFAVRTAVEKETNFADATRYLANVQTIADVYVIIGGVNRGEGIVLTRDRMKSRDWWFINAEQQVDRWWVLETNYDHWVAPPKTDDRRDPGNENMKKLGRTNATGYNMWINVLSVPPVLNKHTVYTVAMSAADPDYFVAKARVL